ncbi:MAG: hypothetical protein R3C45_15700 [Phycisphaerales bacterium]
MKEPPTEDICYATTNRQRAVRELSPDADLVLVVGSQNGSNSVRLTEIAHNSGSTVAKGTPAKLIDDASEIDPAWFAGINRVLVTAGASAPEHLVQQIVQKLVDEHAGEVEHATIVEEDMSFNLPVSLRVLAGTNK